MEVNKSSFIIWVLAVCFIYVANSQSVESLTDGLTIKAVPSVVVDTITDELTIDCRPDKSVSSEIFMGILLEVFKEEGKEKKSYLARQTPDGTMKVSEDNRTSIEGSMEKPSPFLTVTIKEPTLSDEGVYGCKVMYLSTQFKVKTGVTSTNVTVIELPPTTETPVLLADDVTGCACDKIWDEINALKATLLVENQKLKEEVESYSESCRVSFSAQFDSDGIRLRDGPAPFNDVISNKGGAFNKEDSTFVAPCSGQYFFSLTLRSQQRMDSGYVDGLVMVDGQEVVRTSVFIDSPINNYQSATNGAVVTLSKGQGVNVKVKTTSSGRLKGDAYSVFSGFYLYP